MKDKVFLVVLESAKRLKRQIRRKQLRERLREFQDMAESPMGVLLILHVFLLLFLIYKVIEGLIDGTSPILK